jgi:hypothetical protein
MLKWLKQLFFKKSTKDKSSDLSAHISEDLTLEQISLKYNCILQKPRVIVTAQNDKKSTLFAFNIQKHQEEYKAELLALLNKILKKDRTVRVLYLKGTDNQYYPDMYVNFDDLKDELKVLYLMYKDSTFWEAFEALQ